MCVFNIKRNGKMVWVWIPFVVKTIKIPWPLEYVMLPNGASGESLCFYRSSCTISIFFNSSLPKQKAFKYPLHLNYCFLVTCILVTLFVTKVTFIKMPQVYTLQFEISISPSFFHFLSHTHSEIFLFCTS